MRQVVLGLVRRRRRVAFATRLGSVALALVIVGCSESEAPATPASSASTRIEYTQSGGIAGFADRLVVSANGKAVLTTKRATFQRSLSSKEHRRLVRAVAGAHLERLRRRYAPTKPVADGLERSLTFRGRTVVVADGASWPRGLSRALDALAVLVASMRQR